jgi:hypothetical protein
LGESGGQPGIEHSKQLSGERLGCRSAKPGVEVLSGELELPPATGREEAKDGTPWRATAERIRRCAG